MLLPGPIGIARRPPDGGGARTLDCSSCCAAATIDDGGTAADEVGAWVVDWEIVGVAATGCEDVAAGAFGLGLATGLNLMPPTFSV